MQGNLLLNDILAFFEGQADRFIGVGVDHADPHAKSRVATFGFEHQVVPVLTGPFDQVVDLLTVGPNRSCRVENAGSRGCASRIRGEAVVAPGRQHFEHALDVDRFGATRVDHPPFAHQLQQRGQVYVRCSLSSTSVLKSTKAIETGVPDNRPAVLHLQLMRRHQRTRTVDGVQPFGEIDVLGHIHERFLLGNNRHQPGCRPSLRARQPASG